MHVVGKTPGPQLLRGALRSGLAVVCRLVVSRAMLAYAFVIAALAPAPPPAMDAASATALDAALDLALARAVDEVAALDLHATSAWLVETKPPAEHKGTATSSSSSSNASGSSSSSHGSAPSFADAGGASTPGGRTFGVGLQLGYPTAVTAKYMLRPDQGLVFGIGGFSGFAYDVGALSIHVDYVWHPNLLTQGEAFQVTWYVGAGGNILIFNVPRQRTFFPNVPYYYLPTNVWLAARIPIGINLALTQLPFEIYLEADPSILVFPAFGFGIGASIGGRGYF